MGGGQLIRHRLFYVFLFLAILSITIVWGLSSTSYRISATGKMKSVGVEVYWDSLLTDPVTEISWGTLEPGQTVDKNVYVKNTGNTPITITFSTDNWNPVSAEEHLSLTWNYDGLQIQTGKALLVTFSLTVSSSISGVTSFSFDIVLEATG